MGHQIVAGLHVGQLYFASVDAIGPGHCGNLLFAARQPDQARVKITNVISKYLGAVTVGIDGNKQRLQLIACPTQFIQGVGHCLKVRRADIGASRVAEKNQKKLAPKILVCDLLAFLIDQGKGSAEGNREGI